MRHYKPKIIVTSIAISVCVGSICFGEKPRGARPNILFCLADNFSRPHLGAYGDKVVRTPAIDRLAREGVLFTRAFCCSASCTPSRSGILTGQDPWRLEQGANLFGALPAKFDVYPDLLEKAGYHVGYAGKGWGPGSVEAGGRTRNPAGPSYSSFAEFLQERPPDTPFCFWVGGWQRSLTKRDAVSARPFVASQASPDEVEVPPFLPDVEVTRNDLLEYYGRIQGFDAVVGSVRTLLEEADELDNTLVVVAADNGMPFPRGYPYLYDCCTREWLIIRWSEVVQAGRVVDDFVNLIDLAPTFLDAAGVEIPASMTGRTLLSVLRSSRSGQIDPSRDHVIMARERHDWCREGGMGYPSRAIRTADFLYIRNDEPDRWPAGSPVLANATVGLFGDCDPSATKDYIMANRDDPEVGRLYRLAFAKRPAVELYDLSADPHQMHNVADDRRYDAVRQELASRLNAYLKKTGDPRALGRQAPWDDYPYYGKKKLEFTPGAYVPHD